jgi:2,3-bisphosphoglycerate-dependent phosphoglycerate mutase
VEPFADAAELRIHYRDDLRERLLADRFLDDPQTVAQKTWDDFSWSTSSGETNSRAQERFVRCVNQIRAENGTSTILISTHGTVTALYLNALDSSVGVDVWSTLSFPDLRRVEVPSAQWSFADAGSPAR